MSPAEFQEKALRDGNLTGPGFTRRRLYDHSIREDDQGVRMAPRGGRALEAV